mmetsp:Transcript_56951/g.156463  ORF Transcript_56951/g.156463 Transcript_56951/m.156463 type:complete len:87 (+) Transcript_56951:72-332(+)|eukprot:2146164-Prymnesium_polylepis.1
MPPFALLSVCLAVVVRGAWVGASSRGAMRLHDACVVWGDLQEPSAPECTMAPGLFVCMHGPSGSSFRTSCPPLACGRVLCGSVCTR